MDAQNFAYWLNGFAELSGDNPPTKAQWKSIKEHLALVFTKVTPPVIPTDFRQFPKTPVDRFYTPPLTTECKTGALLGGTAAQTYC